MRLRLQLGKLVEEARAKRKAVLDDIHNIKYHIQLYTEKEELQNKLWTMESQKVQHLAHQSKILETLELLNMDIARMRYDINVVNIQLAREGRQ